MSSTRHAVEVPAPHLGRACAKHCAKCSSEAAGREQVKATSTPLELIRLSCTAARHPCSSVRMNVDVAGVCQQEGGTVQQIGPSHVGFQQESPFFPSTLGMFVITALGVALLLSFICSTQEHDDHQPPDLDVMPSRGEGALALGLQQHHLPRRGLQICQPRGSKVDEEPRL